MFCAGSGSSGWNDFSSRVNEATQHDDIFVINGSHVVGAKIASSWIMICVVSSS
jgi:hypothetical protein